MFNKHVILHLSLIDGIGPVALLKLMRQIFAVHLSGAEHASWSDIVFCHDRLDLECIYDYSQSDFVEKFGCSERFAKMLSDGLGDKDMLQREQGLIQKHGVTLVSIFDAGYPEHLRQIYAPPPVLYLQGNPKNLSLKSIAIVGSRKATEYARLVIDNFTTEFVSHGWQIVSGGAEGADTMAHQRALDSGGNTIVVLGSGLLTIYPSSNKQLFKRLVENSNLVISPFSMQTRPDRSTFPARNRVISGLSDATVVIQAAKKSGALITAQFALDQGRHVFAVPGSIYEELSAGCHELIKQGAIPAVSASDILQELGYLQDDLTIIPAQLVKPTPRYNVLSERGESVESPVSLHDRYSVQSDGGSATQGRVSKDYACLDKTHPILLLLEVPQTLDQLIEKTELSFDDLQNQLFDLQLEGKVKQNFMGMWEKL